MKKAGQMRRGGAVAALTVALAAAGCAHDGRRSAPLENASGTLPIERLRVPAGFSVSLFAAGVPNARQMAWSAAGVLYVGSRAEGKVYALPDADRDGRADAVHIVARGLDLPSGVAWKDGALYVAEVSRILRFDDIDRRYADPPAPVVAADGFPTDHAHGWKFIAFGPDGKLYVPIGAPCNVCELSGLYGTIVRIPATASTPEIGTPEIVARGVRNSVGFDWHPETGELWFTDNGRDMLGDDRPPDELNRVAALGQHFGFPFCHGGEIADPEFGVGAPCSDFVPPAQKLGAHVASIGMRFYTGAQFPARYRGAVFIAEHGSWNRSSKVGYRVSVVRLEGDRPIAYEPFAEGWLDDDEVWGRPADVLVAPDGALLVADDLAGAIYRIAYRDQVSAVDSRSARPASRGPARGR